MKSQTDKTTARPWQMTRVNQSYGCYGWAINRKGFEPEGNSQGQGRTIAWVSTDGEDARAEAALIVRAVNEHAALCAVAEAANELLTATYSGATPKELAKYNERLEFAIAHLASIRNK